MSTGKIYCDCMDWNCHSDSCYVKKCKYYHSKSKMKQEDIELYELVKERIDQLEIKIDIDEL